MARHIPANEAVRAARRGTTILASIPVLLILPLMGGLFLFGASQTQERKDIIKQSWERGGGERAVDALSACMKGAGFGGEIDIVRSYFMLGAVAECEQAALKMARARDLIGKEAHDEYAPTVKEIEGAARERKQTIDGVI